MRVRNGTVGPMGNVDLTALGDVELADLANSVRDEYRRRALDAGVPDAVADEAFDRGFGPDGLAVIPWVEANMVVCCGGKEHSSASSHKCRFAVVDGEWVWESSERLYDEMRHTGKAGSNRTVSLVPAREGLVVEVVTSKFRSGKHERVGLRRFEVRGGEIVEVEAVSHRVPEGSHR